jgi:hypothetical protein
VVAATALALGVAVSPGTGAGAAAKSVLLGSRNTATTTTTIADAKGTPLALTSPSNRAPLAVNSRTKVTNLNADSVDGYDSSVFARAAGKTGFVLAPDVNTAAVCPAGTVLTGGAGFSEDTTVTPATPLALLYSGPAFDDNGFIPNSWLVIGPSNGTDYSLALCYNPKGAVPGALSAMAAQKLVAKSRVGLAAAKR